jgi:N-acetylneuraminic acid mutarotase
VPDKKPIAKKWHITQLKTLPEPITNNAVAEGFIKGKPYTFTFGGLDSTKLYSGIHKRNYKLDISNNTWQQIADLPDSLGKIASAASRIKNIIYILGGYHVFDDHSEKSSNKVHRYDILKNQFLEDGASIPVPIDDHVQAVWRDSLIYVITGWSDKENVPNVQIYNPEINSWSIGNSVPDNHIYKSFGASGTIIGDTIFYFGGASMGKHYPIQNSLRKGIINKNNPTQIIWSHQVLDSTIVGYRMAATQINNIPHWIGGSTSTYNYNAIAYDGSGGVNPSNRDLYLSNNKLSSRILKNLPMDLRGIGEINDSTKIIIGGIEKNQKVSTKVYLLEWKE